jgi:hypothetical protein
LEKFLHVGGQILFHVCCCKHIYITNMLVQYGLGEIREIIDCVKGGYKILDAIGREC